MERHFSNPPISSINLHKDFGNLTGLFALWNPFNFVAVLCSRLGVVDLGSWDFLSAVFFGLGLFRVQGSIVLQICPFEIKLSEGF
jgi:hypothetical protein